MKPTDNMKSILLVQYDMKIKTDTIIILVYPSATSSLPPVASYSNCRLLPMVT